jgi:transcriptional regulator with XRE-family HTH domain
MTRRPRTPARERRQQFGAALAEARKLAGLTQRQLAERVDVVQSVVSSWETGERAPDQFDIVFEVEDALDLSPGRLSAHLGFLPITLDGESAPLTATDGITADPDLDIAAKRSLLESVKAFKGRR